MHVVCVSAFVSMFHENRHGEKRRRRSHRGTTVQILQKIIIFEGNKILDAYKKLSSYFFSMSRT